MTFNSQLGHAQLGQFQLGADMATGLFLSVGDTFSWSDTLTIFTPNIKFSDGFAFNDFAAIVLNLPLSIGDVFNFSDLAITRITGSLIAFSESDSFNWSDSVNLAIGIPISVSDSWSLSEGIKTSILYTLNIGESWTLTDEISIAARMLSKVTTGDTWSLTDQIGTFSAAFMACTDGFAFGDAIRLNLRLNQAIFTDSFTFSDHAQAGVNHVVPYADGFAMSDSVSLQLNIAVLADCDYFPWLDSVELDLFYTAPQVVEVADYFEYDDEADLFLTGVTNVSDGFAWFDSVILNLATVPTNVFSDSFSWTDGITLQLGTSVLMFTDSFTWSDSMSFTLGTSNTAYLRRYLNDIVGPGNP